MTIVNYDTPSCVSYVSSLRFLCFFLAFLMFRSCISCVSHFRFLGFALACLIYPPRTSYAPNRLRLFVSLALRMVNYRFCAKSAVERFLLLR